MVHGTFLIFVPAFDLDITWLQKAEGHDKRIGQVGIGDEGNIEIYRSTADEVIVVELAA